VDDSQTHASAVDNCGNNVGVGRTGVVSGDRDN